MAAIRGVLCGAGYYATGVSVHPFDGENTSCSSRKIVVTKLQGRELILLVVTRS